VKGKDPHLDIRWSEESPAELNQLAAEAVEVRFEPADRPVRLVVEGRCPACRGPLRHVQPIEVFLGEDDEVEDLDSYRAIVWCDCRMRHRGAADSVTGCGRFFGLDIEAGR
jgi:hypothetical protein